MFKRNQPRPLHRRAIGAVWPEMGWRRATQYTLIRIGRLPGTGYAIAGGFAWGAAMSFTPFIGLHIAIAVFAAWITRCSIVSAVIGTVVGNPWTFPFIWIWLYKAGVAMGFGQSGMSAETMDFSGLFGEVTAAALKGDWSFILDTAVPILMPMLVASIPTATIVWVIFYLLLKPTIGRYKSAAAARRSQRLSVQLEAIRQE